MKKIFKQGDNMAYKLLDYEGDMKALNTTMEVMKKKYSGYGYHGGGRKPKGEESKTCTMSIVCTSSEKAKIKELAEKANKTISAYCVERILK